MEALGSPVDSGTIPLNFTFVPSVGTLPSEVVLAKDSNYVPKIVSHKGSLMQKPEDIPEKFTERNMHESPQSMLDTAGKAASQDSLMQKKSDTNNPENINHKDLFIAEFVVVMDDDEDEIITKEYQTLPFEESKYKFRETPQRSWQPKVEVKVKELYDHSLQENCRDVGELGTKKIYPVPSVVLDSCSTQSSYSSYPDKTQVYRRQTTNSVPTNIYKPNTAVKDTFHLPLLSQKTKSLHILGTEFPVSSYTRRSLYSSTDLEISEHKASNITQSGRPNVLSPLPIQVIKYPLCRSPSPLSSPHFGSSSTIYSMNENISPVPKPDATTAVSSRLSFLTSLLKSKRSCFKRAISPYHHYQSEAKTISVTNSYFQKSSMIPHAHRKAISCVSLNYPRESKMPYFQRKAEMMSSVSESDILHGEFSFHQSPNRALSPDSIHFKSSTSALLSPKGSVSPSSQLLIRSITPPSFSREHILSLNDKPPISRLPSTCLKKYSVPGKSKRVTLFPPPLNINKSLCQLPDEKKREMPHLKKYSTPRIHFRATPHFSSKTSYPLNAMTSSSIDIKKNHGLYAHAALLCNKNMKTDQDTCQLLHPNYSCQAFSSKELSSKNTPLCSISTNIMAQPKSTLSRSCDLPSGSSLSLISDLENKKLYKIKSSYKAFAAIPTNTLLLDQKAIDDPQINRRNSDAEDRTDPHTEMCSPALLRQQTEEICAVIDEVLHGPFPTSSNSVSRSPKLKSEKKSGCIPRPPLKSAGRETKYATLQPLINKKANDPQITRPGVIRPMAANESRKCYPNLFQQFSLPPNKS
ncbi:muscular LMNA-interacting protein isoform X1 [Bufo bufo]|uniref:muscular LMNA-interacting protein isoform X1 n=1 Tax=Bufo bufo TaxID=8384 RepID=UPI001ABE5D6C|nr:muscular LMNA-interacting protein isoform X1 [Bufo bufo]